MKRFLKIFLTVAACCTVCSCNKDTTNSVSGILAAADSIMSDSPEKALEYLSSLDSTVTAGINRKELAMLHTAHDGSKIPMLAAGRQ